MHMRPLEPELDYLVLVGSFVGLAIPTDLLVSIVP